MTAVLSQFLESKVVIDRRKRFVVRNAGLQTILGMQPGGINAGRIAPSRTFHIDIFNDSNKVPPAVRPEGRSISLDRQPVGGYTVTVPKTFFSKFCSLESLINQRPLGGPAGSIDEGGANYLMAQEDVIDQELSNVREFMVAGMLRGSFTYTMSGESLIHDFSGGSITVDYQIPAGFKSQLDMLGAGSIIDASWATASTNIPLHLSKINAAFQQETGSVLTDVIISSVGWENVKNNTKVINQSGSVNRPYTELDADPISGLVQARIASHPWVRWWIYDHVLKVGSSYTATKLVPDTVAVFLANHPKAFEYYELASPVIERPGRDAIYPRGKYQWATPSGDPAGVKLYGKDDGIPVLNNPKAIACGTVVF